jgi:hypothetical protein
VFNTKPDWSQKGRVFTAQNGFAWYENTLLGDNGGGTLEQGNSFWSGIHQDV